MSREQSQQKKPAVLEEIKKQRHILFGSFKGNKTSKQEKEKTWAEVLKTAQSLGLAGPDKPPGFVRDRLFGLWKSRTLAKRDNARKTGSQGGKNCKLDAVDMAILDIISSESDVVIVLQNTESYEDENINGISTERSSENQDVSVLKNSASSNPVQSARTYRKRKLSGSRASLDDQTSARLSFLKVETYYRQLKCLELEKRLGIPPSAFTRNIISPSISSGGNLCSNLSTPSPLTPESHTINSFTADKHITDEFCCTESESSDINPIQNERTLEFTEF